MKPEIAAKDKYVSFKIPVSSFTRKGQLSEIRESLRTLYPKEADENSIFFSKRRRSGEVWVCVIEDAGRNRYVSEELWLENRRDRKSCDASLVRKSCKRTDIVSRYRKSDGIKKALIIVLLAVLAVFSYMRATEGKRSRARAQADERRAIEEANRRKREEAKRADRRIAELEKELEALEEQKGMDFYNIALNLFSALDAGDRIELLDMKSDGFYMEAKCADKAGVLERLCENPNFADVALLRSNRADEKDETVFKGKVLKGAIDRKQNLERPERLEYLEGAVGSLQQSTQKDNQTAPEYLRNLKSAFDEKAIKEEYTEYIEGTGFRISISASINNLILFTKDRNDITSLHLSLRGNSCTATMEFRHSFSQVRKSAKGAIDENKILNGISAAREEKKTQSTRQNDRLNYILIGKAKQDGIDYAVFKDVSTSKLYRFRLDGGLSEDGTCRRRDNGTYVIRMDSKEYEVR